MLRSSRRLVCLGWGDGAVAALAPGLASLGAVWLAGTMFFGVLTHLFVLHTSPVPAIVLGLLNTLIVYLRRDELAAVIRTITKVL